MRELALHILDIAENSISAGASQVEISVVRNTRENQLVISVRDNGNGMDEEMLARVINPFVTSRTTRKVGLGIPMLKQAAEACNGGLTVDSQPGKGTEITATFQNNHIDRMPLGNLADTFLSLLIGTPDVNWVLDYQADDQVFHFDDREVKAAIEGMPLTDYRVIEYLTATIKDGVAGINNIEVIQGVNNANN
ncbi:MAG: ATP-binding protein [Chloroflexi bacterium]|nr:ATP-binding protein [Chloroflexota bacterium]